jgi:hypothetical protein
MQQPITISAARAHCAYIIQFKEGVVRVRAACVCVILYARRINACMQPLFNVDASFRTFAQLAHGLDLRLNTRPTDEPFFDIIL